MTIQHVDVQSNQRAHHVRQTRRYLEDELCLNRLLDLSYDIVPAGRPALELVLSMLLGDVGQTNWGQLHALNTTPRGIIAAAEGGLQALSELQEWSADALEEEMLCVAAQTRLDPAIVKAVLSVMVLHRQCPLPLAATLEILGRDTCLSRLKVAIRAYQVCQLIG